MKLKSLEKSRIFLKELKEKFHTNPFLCLQCFSCSNGCPYVELMDEPPHKIIRLLQLGLIERAFSSSAIWICVGCNTCSSQCPMGIDIPVVFDSLKKEAINLNIFPDIDIVKFHREVLNSIKRHGRTHKLEIMFNFKLKSGSFLKDLDVGLKMLYKGKLELFAESISSSDIKEIFDLYE